MTGIYRNILVWLCSTCVQSAFADEPLVIRGDQSVSLLSDLPAEVKDSHDIFSVSPRLTKRDELMMLLGNVELFITPPEQAYRTDESAQTSQTPNSEKKFSTGVSP